jgi:LacI family transcriptional regulator
MDRITVTIVDVARVAGVSQATASRVLNSRSGFSDETARKVRHAAEELGYQPNALARGLLAGQSGTVGLITTGSFGRFSIPLVQGAEDALGPRSLSLFVCDGRGDPIREQHHLRTLLERRVDGIIVTGHTVSTREPIGHKVPVPVVYAMTRSTDADDLSLLPDDEQGTELVIRHLLSGGRTRIGHITGPGTYASARLRASATQQVLSEAGCPVAGGSAMFGQWSEEWGRQAAAMLLRADPSVDAIFCGNDQVARGAADTVRETGRMIPDDVAVVGFDNWDVFVASCRPPLTTVDMNLRELGHLTGQLLLDSIDGRSASGLRKLPCTLISRESSRPELPQ